MRHLSAKKLQNGFKAGKHEEVLAEVKKENPEFLDEIDNESGLKLVELALKKRRNLDGELSIVALEFVCDFINQQRLEEIKRMPNLVKKSRKFLERLGERAKNSE